MPTASPTRPSVCASTGSSRRSRSSTRTTPPTTTSGCSAGSTPRAVSMRPPFTSSSNTTNKNRTPTMKTILLLTTAIIFTAARADEQVISTFSWKELADAGKLTAGTLTGAPDNALKVENRGPGAMSATVLTIMQRKITTDFYAVIGEVRYDNVEGDGFLEMWSHFGETAAYFSRTLGVAGPMAKLTAP